MVRVLTVLLYLIRGGLGSTRPLGVRYVRHCKPLLAIGASRCHRETSSYDIVAMKKSNVILVDLSDDEEAAASPPHRAAATSTALSHIHTSHRDREIGKYYIY